MYAFLRGVLHAKQPGTVVLDVGGVGYRVQIPLSTFYELGPVGGEVTLRVTHQVREDALHLYGFLTAGEQTLFEHLTSVSGVGPRIAIAVLSGLPVDEIVAALAGGDAGRLRSIPGVGRRTAERLVVELRDRMAALAAPGDSGPPPGPPAGPRGDLVSALVNLGYPRAQAEKAADQALRAGPPSPELPSLLREALRRLHR